MDMTGAANEETKDGTIKEETGLPEDEGPAEELGEYCSTGGELDEGTPPFTLVLATGACEVCEGTAGAWLARSAATAD